MFAHTPNNKRLDHLGGPRDALLTGKKNIQAFDGERLSINGMLRLELNELIRVEV